MKSWIPQYLLDGQMLTVIGNWELEIGHEKEAEGRERRAGGKLFSLAPCSLISRLVSEVEPHLPHLPTPLTT